jgi:hypothetical protein
VTVPISCDIHLSFLIQIEGMHNVFVTHCIILNFIDILSGTKRKVYDSGV